MTDYMDELRTMWGSALSDAARGMANKNAAETGDVATAYSYRGVNDDGIEVYETSAETKKLPYSERIKQYIKIMRNEYRGRTAKFMRNGHSYYALFSSDDVRKDTYGDKRSDERGQKAKVNVGADGNIFELVENAKYVGSKSEEGKKTDAHKNVKYWDYFIKQVQIDGRKYDVLANVRKRSDNSYVYSIQVNESKKIKGTAARKSSSKNGFDSQMGVVPSGNSIRTNEENVNTKSEKNSARDVAAERGKRRAEIYSELQRLRNERNNILEQDADYAAAQEKRRHAQTFKERVEATRAINAAKAKIDTAELDERIQSLQDERTAIDDEERAEYNAEKEKYSGAKTRGYAELPDTRTAELDSEYNDAIKRGDKKTMQALVLEAAERAMPSSVIRDADGKLLPVYHWTNASFNSFDRSYARTGNEMDGFFFAPDARSTREYGDNAVRAYLNITNPAYDPYLDRTHEDSGTLLREKLAYEGYDGVIRTENGKIVEYMAFDPEQIKSADAVVYDDNGRVIPLSERFNAKKNDIRYSARDYSYTTLISKPDIRLTTVTEKASYDRRAVIADGMQNLLTVGHISENGNAIVHVADTNTDVIVTEKALRHGMDRRFSKQAPVLEKIGEVLTNSIKINELTPREENVENTYVLIGAAKTEDGVLYVTSFVVNRNTKELESYDVLYSANVKKGLAAFLPTVTGHPDSFTNPTISVAGLLEYVNKLYPDILPEDVLKQFGHTERPEGKIGSSALYSMRDVTENDTKQELAERKKSYAQLRRENAALILLCHMNRSARRDMHRTARSRHAEESAP